MRHPLSMYPKLVYMEGSLLDLADALAEQDERFHSRGRPSSSAVIREATRIFFVLPIRLREQLLEESKEHKQAS